MRMNEILQKLSETRKEKGSAIIVKNLILLRETGIKWKAERGGKSGKVENVLHSLFVFSSAENLHPSN